jgi:plasmid stabilization system protein ParE
VVSWSLRARADLKAIHDHIAKDAPMNARTVVREIVNRANLIDQTPRGGRKVPELDDESIRELPVYSWRVIYQLRETSVFIVTLVHKRRAPAPEALRPA